MDSIPESLSLRKRENTHNSKNFNCLHSRIDFQLNLRKQNINNQIILNRQKYLSEYNIENKKMTENNKALNEYNSIDTFIASNIIKGNSLKDEYNQQKLINRLIELLNQQIDNEKILFNLLNIGIDIILLEDEEHKTIINRKLLLKNQLSLDIYKKIYFKYKLKIELKVQFLKFIGFLISQNKDFQILIYESGIFTDVLKSFNLTLNTSKDIDNTIWFLSQFSSPRIYNNNSKLNLALQKVYFEIILAGNGINFPLLNNTLWGISLISVCSDKTFVNNFFKFDILSFMCNIKVKNQNFKEPIMRTFGNIFANPFNEIEKSITPEMIQYIIRQICYKGNSNEIKKLGVWALSNIVFEERFINKVFQFKIIDIFIDLCQSTENLHLIKELVHAIGGIIVTCNDEQRILIIKQMNICSVLINTIGKVANRIYNDSDEVIHICFFCILNLLKYEEYGNTIECKAIFENLGLIDLIQKIIIELEFINPNNGFTKNEIIQSIIKIGDAILKVFECE